MNKVETVLIDNNVELDELQEVLEQLTLKAKQLKEIDSEIQNEITLLKDIEEEIVKCNEHEENIVTFKCKVKRTIEKRNSCQITSNVNEQNKTTLNLNKSPEAPASIRLPFFIFRKV